MFVSVVLQSIRKAFLWFSLQVFPSFSCIFHTAHQSCCSLLGKITRLQEDILFKVDRGGEKWSCLTHKGSNYYKAFDNGFKDLRSCAIWKCCNIIQTPFWSIIYLLLCTVIFFSLYAFVQKVLASQMFGKNQLQSNYVYNIPASTWLLWHWGESRLSVKCRF